MITARTLRDRLAERPFRPFSVHLSDQSKFDVPHPEFAWVIGGSLLVGISGDLPAGLDDSFRQLAIMHITRIEPFPPLPAQKTRESKKVG